MFYVCCQNRSTAQMLRMTSATSFSWSVKRSLGTRIIESIGADLKDDLRDLTSNKLDVIIGGLREIQLNRALRGGRNMDQNRSYVRNAILMILAAPLGPLLLALGLDYLWLGKTLMESLRHWSSSALGVPLGIFTAFLIVGLYRRWRPDKTKQSPELDHTA